MLVLPVQVLAQRIACCGSAMPFDLCQHAAACHRLFTAIQETYLIWLRQRSRIVFHTHTIIRSDGQNRFIHRVSLSAVTAPKYPKWFYSPAEWRTYQLDQLSCDRHSSCFRTVSESHCSS